MNKILKEETLYTGRVCRFTHNEVEFEDGTTGYRDILHLPGAVGILAIDNNNKFLFVKQHRHAISDTILEIPAGMIELSEDKGVTALRELQEETGYHANHLEYLCEFYTSPGVVNEKIYLYFAKDLEYVHQDLDEDEYLSVQTFTEEEVEEMIRTNVIKDAKTMIAFAHYKQFIKK